MPLTVEVPSHKTEACGPGNMVEVNRYSFKLNHGGNFSLERSLLNAAVVLVGGGLALLTSVRYANWGPEGPVGGWLLLVPYLFMAAAVTAVLIALGTFSWVPGGRLTCFSIWVGLLVAFAVSGYYSMSDLDTKYEQFAALSGWLLLAAAVALVAPVVESIEGRSRAAIERHPAVFLGDADLVARANREDLPIGVWWN
jgi:hypothetical protein